MHKKTFPFARIVFEIRTMVFIELMITFFLLCFSVMYGHRYVTECVLCILVTNLMRAMVICGNFLTRQQRRKERQSVWALAVSLAAGIGLHTAAGVFCFAPQSMAGPKKLLFLAAMSGVLCILSIPDILLVRRKDQIQLHTYRCLSVTVMAQTAAIAASALLMLAASEETIRYPAAAGGCAAIFTVIWDARLLADIRSRAKAQTEAEERSKGK